MKGYRSCSVDGCDRKHFGRGWCSTHYSRWYVYGDVDADRPVGWRVGTSEVVHGTDDGYSNHGCRCDECREAYGIAYGMRQTIRGRRLGSCSINGCDLPQYARGLCHPHYERQRTGRPMVVPIRERPGARVFNQ